MARRIQCSIILLGKILKLILVKKFPEFSRTHRLVTVFKTVRHYFLRILKQINTVHNFPSCLRSILILSSHLSLGCPSSPFPSGFPRKIHPYLFPPMRTKLPAHPYALQWQIGNASSALKVKACWHTRSSYIRIRGRCVSMAENYLVTSQAYTSCTKVTAKYNL